MDLTLVGVVFVLVVFSLIWWFVSAEYTRRRVNEENRRTEAKERDEKFLYSPESERLVDASKRGIVSLVEHPQDEWSLISNDFWVGTAVRAFAYHDYKAIRDVWLRIEEEARMEGVEVDHGKMRSAPTLERLVEWVNAQAYDLAKLSSPNVVVTPWGCLSATLAEGMVQIQLDTDDFKEAQLHKIQMCVGETSLVKAQKSGVWHCPFAPHTNEYGWKFEEIPWETPLVLSLKEDSKTRLIVPSIKAC